MMLAPVTITSLLTFGSAYKDQSWMFEMIS